MAEPRLITAESVTEGHPDKICDQISDAILDDLLAQDKASHVAVETSATRGQFFVFGEIDSQGYSEVQQVVRNVVREIGYTSSHIGLDADSCYGACSTRREPRCRCHCPYWHFLYCRHPRPRRPSHR